jgi:TonB family protein
MAPKARRGSSRVLVAVMSILTAAPGAWAQNATLEPSPYAAWAAKMPSTLRLSQNQKAAFERWLASASPDLASGGDLSTQQYIAMTPPQRSDYVAHRLEKDLVLTRAEAKALHDFYTQLSPDQRRLFDNAMAPPSTEHVAPSNGGALDEPPPPPNLKLLSHTDPDWMVVPTPDDVSRVFPRAATAARISGKVRLQCQVDTDGYLTECVVEDETPAGHGFGNAALEITAYMRMKPATTLGIPVWATVDVPVNFKVP